MIYAHLFLATSFLTEFRRWEMRYLPPTLEAMGESRDERHRFGLFSIFLLGNDQHGHYHEDYRGPVREAKP